MCSRPVCNKRQLSPPQSLPRQIPAQKVLSTVDREITCFSSVHLISWTRHALREARLRAKTRAVLARKSRVSAVAAERRFLIGNVDSFMRSSAVPAKEEHHQGNQPEAARGPEGNVQLVLAGPGFVVKSDEGVYIRFPPAPAV